MSRRFTILSTVSLLLLLLWSVPDAFAQRVVNENGGFEDAEIGATTGIANWDLWLSAEDPPTVELEVVADPDNSDNKVLKATLVDIPSGSDPWDAQLAHYPGDDLPLVEGTRYQLELRVRAENPEAATVSLDSGMGVAVYGRAISGTEWSIVQSEPFTADAEGGRVVVHLSSPNNSNGQIIYVDHVHVIDLDYEEPAAEFLNNDGSFESYPVGNFSDGQYWYHQIDDANDVTATIVADPVQDGDVALSIDIAEFVSGNLQFMNQAIDIDGPGTYRISSYARASDAGAQMQLVGDHQGGNYSWFGTQTFTLTEDWAEYTIEFEVPEESGDVAVTQIRANHILANAANSGNTVYIDNVRVAKVEDDVEEPPVDNTFAFGFESLDGIDSWTNTSSDPGLVLDLSDDRVEGESSLSFSYDFIADEDWGGSVDIGVEAPGETGLYADLSDADGVTFRYKVIAPSSATADAAFAIKLVDASGSDEEGDDEEDEEEGPLVEHWEYRTTLLLTDDSDEWQELRVPFESFNLPQWGDQGNGTLDLDQISGFEMQVVVGGSGVDNTYTGEFLVDALALYTEAEEPVDPIDPDYPRPPHAFGDVLNINGSFELEEVGPASGVTAWSLTTNSVTPMDVISDSQDDDGRALRFDFEWDSAAAETYNVEAVSEPFYPGEGDVIRASVWLRSDTDGAVAMLYLGLPESGSWARRPGYGQEMNVTLSTEWQEFVYPDYTVIAADISHADESMRFGISLNFEENDGAQIDIDNMRVRKVDLSDSNEGRLAHEFSLKSAYPNPFSGSTTIEYSLDAAGPVSIQVFNLLGQQVATLVDEVQGAGAHRATLDARDFAAGVYIYRITAGDKTDSKTMMVVR